MQGATGMSQYHELPNEQFILVQTGYPTHSWSSLTAPTLYQEETYSLKLELRSHLIKMESQLQIRKDRRFKSSPSCLRMNIRIPGAATCPSGYDHMVSPISRGICRDWGNELGKTLSLSAHWAQSWWHAHPGTVIPYVLGGNGGIIPHLHVSLEYLLPCSLLKSQTWMITSLHRTLERSIAGSWTFNTLYWIHTLFWAYFLSPRTNTQY